jgi:hypothetical protein
MEITDSETPMKGSCTVRIPAIILNSYYFNYNAIDIIIFPDTFNEINRLYFFADYMYADPVWHSPKKAIDKYSLVYKRT